MKKMVLAFATVLVVGAFALAQSSGQNQTTNDTQGTTMSSPQSEHDSNSNNQSSSGSATTSSSQPTGDPNQDHGIDKLNDLYRQAEDPNNPGWLNPNVTLSAPGDSTN